MSAVDVLLYRRGPLKCWPYQQYTGSVQGAMKKGTLQSLLHWFYPHWDESVCAGREELSFSFVSSGQKRWEWLAAGKHVDVLRLASQEMAALGLPGEFGQYWVCCFYSDYQPENGAADLAAIKGPPFLEVACPSSFVGEEWAASIERVRSELLSRHALEGEGELIRWFWDVEVASEVGRVALQEMKNLGLPREYAMAWICCFLPEGAKWMADRAVTILERFPQFVHWGQFVCTGQGKKGRVRAFPFGIDWSEGADEKYQGRTTMWDLQERGMALNTQSDPQGNIRMTLSWQPETVRTDEWRRAVEYAQRYYHDRLEPAQRTPLRDLTELFTNRAKMVSVSQRKESAMARYKSGEATLEQLLSEEALRPDTQRQYAHFKQLCHESSAERTWALEQIRLLRKRTYDRGRSWLAGVGKRTRLAKHPPWWEDVLPNP